MGTHGCQTFGSRVRIKGVDDERKLIIKDTRCCIMDLFTPNYALCTNGSFEFVHSPPKQTGDQVAYR